MEIKKLQSFNLYLKKKKNSLEHFNFKNDGIDIVHCRVINKNLWWSDRISEFFFIRYKLSIIKR